ncbi:MAG: DUF3486 family protein [Desulfarculus sp.]|nr:DUF3486 family protein [Desulfarculus sp.]
MSGAPGQMDLPLGRGVDLQRRMKAALARALKESRYSREQIAERVNDALEAEGNAYRVSPAALDRWAAPSDSSHNLPAWLAPALCRAIGSHELVAIQVEALGMSILDEHGRQFLVYGKADFEAKRQAKIKRQAQLALEEMR